MLGDQDVMATIGVRDVKTSADFYEKTLGLKRGRSGMGTVQMTSGASTILIYPSQYAGTNQATALTWAVDNVERVVAELKARGVRFEHYDLPNARRDGDVHVFGDIRNAWFKDPDGNIVSIVNRA